jgi:hypothetical protein
MYNGVLITSVASNSSIKLDKVGAIETGGDAYDVWVDENLEFAYVTCGYHGLRIFDISDMSNPDLLAHVPESSPIIYTGHSSGYAHQLFVDNNLIYVGDGPSGLTIIDASDRLNPQVLTHFDGGYTWDIAVNEDLAYIVNGFNNRGSPGFMVVNVSDPSDPDIISNSQTDGDTTDIELVENLVYLVKNTGGLRILDISNNSEPVLLGQYSYPSGAYAIDVEIFGELAFLSLWQRGLKILDISDPSNIIELGEFTDMGELTFLSVSNGFVYLAAMTDGVIVLDFNDTNFPVVGTYSDSGKPYGIFVRDNYVFVADQDEGFKILRINSSSNDGFNFLIPSLGILLFALIIYFPLSKKRRKGANSKIN